MRKWDINSNFRNPIAARPRNFWPFSRREQKQRKSFGSWKLIIPVSHASGWQTKAPGMSQMSRKTASLRNWARHDKWTLDHVFHMQNSENLRQCGVLDNHSREMKYSMVGIQIFRNIRMCMAFNWAHFVGFGRNIPLNIGKVTFLTFKLSSVHHNLNMFTDVLRAKGHRVRLNICEKEEGERTPQTCQQLGTSSQIFRLPQRTSKSMSADIFSRKEWGGAGATKKSLIDNK